VKDENMGNEKENISWNEEWKLFSSNSNLKVHFDVLASLVRFKKFL